jgi:hypothetical protein
VICPTAEAKFARRVVLSQPRRSRMGKGGRRLQDKPTGKLIALQIKSGESFFKKRGNNYVFYGEIRHLEYWTKFSLPVFLILNDT